MKRIMSIAFVAGTLFGAGRLSAQEFPVSIPTVGTDFIRKAHDAARNLLFSEPAEFSLQWLREEVDPILRARRQLRHAMLSRAEEQQSVIAVPQTSRRDLNKEVGMWRMSIGNTSVNNWSDFPDRMLDARTIRFPMRRDSRADKRTDQQKALDKMRQQRR